MAKSRFNESKVKTFLILYRQRVQCGDLKGMTVRELNRATGVSLSYLQHRVKQWAKWKYLSRTAVDDSNGGVLFRYRISRKGIDYLEFNKSPKLIQGCVDELRERKANLERL